MHPIARRDVAAWTLYDFASSAFNTLMVTFIFNRFFTDVIAGGTDAGVVMWTMALNISAVSVAVLMPVLGAIADYSGRKKLFLTGSRCSRSYSLSPCSSSARGRRCWR